MKICQVERPLVSTNRIAMMEHKLLQVVRDGSSLAVAVDASGFVYGVGFESKLGTHEWWVAKFNP